MVNVMKEKLSEIVGVENVCDDFASLELYSKDQSFAKPMKPRCIVKVSKVEEIQKIVQWANETKTPLIPISSGGLHYKGDTVPGVPEAVMVDLSGMKKILSINRQHRMAIVEPGVTYAELQEALAKEGMTLSTCLAPKAEKSVLTSVLEIEPRLNSIHQWNYTDPLRCMEVVWGDGNKMFTGEAGGGVQDLEKQWSSEKFQISGTGPMMLDFYRLLTAAQGSMGIVSWASLKCEILPTIHKLYFVPAKKSEDLNDFVYRVVRLRFSDELMIVNGAYLAALLGESVAQIQELQQELPQWVALVGIAGRELLPEQRVAAQEGDITEIAQQFGLKMLPAITGVTGEKVLQKITEPSGEKYWKETSKGAFQDILFLTNLDKTPKFIAAMNRIAEEMGYPTRDIGVYIQPMHAGTSYHCEFHLPYNPENIKEVDRMKKLFTKASEEISQLGGYFSRPYGIWSKLQLNKDAQSTITIKKIKDIFDPNHIMNPGKISI